VRALPQSLPYPGVNADTGATEVDTDGSADSTRGGDSGGRAEPSPGVGPDAGPGSDAGSDGAGDAGEFGRRGWLLVAAVVLATLVIPGIIYLRPATPADMGLSFIAAMLVLPLVPALLLGLTAVWSMTTAARSDREH